MSRAASTFSVAARLLPILGGLLLGPLSFALVNSDPSFERAIQRCNAIGYPEKSDPWRECVREQLRILGASSEPDSGPVSSPNQATSTNNTLPAVDTPFTHSGPPVAPSAAVGSQPAPEGVNNSETVKGLTVSPFPAPRVTPPTIKRQLTANQNRACFAGYIGPEIALEYMIEVDVSGKARLVEWSEAYPKSARKAVECSLSKELYEPARQDGAPVVAQVRQGITIGRAHRPSELPSVVLPRYRGVETAEAVSCYPGGFIPNNQIDVEVEVVVGKDGRITGSRATDTISDSALRKVAECVAKASRFDAGRIRGKAASMTVQLKVAVKY